jgi:hypothetical protein
VEVEEGIEPLSADRPDQADEFPAVLLGRDDDRVVDVGMAFHEPAVWLLDEICQGGVRKMLFKKGDGGGRQDDVAEAPESKEKDGSRLNV